MPPAFTPTLLEFPMLFAKCESAQTESTLRVLTGRRAMGPGRARGWSLFRVHIRYPVKESGGCYMSHMLTESLVAIVSRRVEFNSCEMVRHATGPPTLWPKVKESSPSKMSGGCFGESEHGCWPHIPKQNKRERRALPLSLEHFLFTPIRGTAFIQACIEDCAIECKHLNRKRSNTILKLRKRDFNL